VAGQLLRAGMGGAEIDMAAALAALTAEGLPAWVATNMLGAIAQGMAEGQARRQEDVPARGERPPIVTPRFS
jgi:hypothetical protein